MSRASGRRAVEPAHGRRRDERGMELVIIRNGVLSSLRARGRAVLFALLIFGVTVSLSLGLGMWAYCAQMLQRCDEN